MKLLSLIGRLLPWSQCFLEPKNVILLMAFFLDLLFNKFYTIHTLHRSKVWLMFLLSPFIFISQRDQNNWHVPSQAVLREGMPWCLSCNNWFHSLAHRWKLLTNIFEILLPGSSRMFCVFWPTCIKYLLCHFRFIC